MRAYKAPEKVSWGSDDPFVFLAGSIEMGAAENWQERATHWFSDYGFNVLNPRRDDWNPGWRQSITNPQFKEQVTWELECQENCDVILMHFCEETKSPITLLELGLFCERTPLVVSCPLGFWRRGTVEIVCDRYGVRLLDSLEAAIPHAIEKARGS